MSFDGLLINHMKVVQVAGDQWQEPTDTVGSAIPCRIMYQNKLMRNYSAEEVLSAAKIFCKPEDITFDHEDKLQLDIESYQIDHPIIIIVQPQNSLIIHHAEIWVT